jgi:Oxidoreductase molybdopterin binding domain
VSKSDTGNRILGSHDVMKSLGGGLCRWHSIRPGFGATRCVVIRHTARPESRGINTIGLNRWAVRTGRERRCVPSNFREFSRAKNRAVCLCRVRHCHIGAAYSGVLSLDRLAAGLGAVQSSVMAAVSPSGSAPAPRRENFNPAREAPVRVAVAPVKAEDVPICLTGIARSRPITPSWSRPRSMARSSRSVGADLTAKYVAFRCFDDYYGSIDMATALHPQTILATRYAKEYLGDPFGFPLRLRTATTLGFQESQMDHLDRGDQQLSGRLLGGSWLQLVQRHIGPNGSHQPFGYIAISRCLRKIGQLRM